MGQGTFRGLVTDAYGRACAVTRSKTLPVLEAAHIVPYADGGQNVIRNGLLLRSDIHTLFDRGYLTVTPDLTFDASERLTSEFNNGQEYLAMRGTKVWVPGDPDLQPDRDALAWHASEKFVA